MNESGGFGMYIYSQSIAQRFLQASLGSTREARKGAVHPSLYISLPLQYPLSYMHIPQMYLASLLYLFIQ